ncbi:MAG: alpha/beta hydrolase [Bacteroidetes bacterium]|nr:alpha/beta hydrolase [Bacteroidota bacterium]
MKNYKLLVFVVISVIILSSCNIYHISVPEDKACFHFEMVEIGGIKQAIMIKGDNKNNPVILYLHGGPGFPLFPFEPTETIMKQLEKNYNIVYWEQRGTGKSWSRRLSSKNMNVEQFVQDTKEVIEYTQKITGVDKVFIWGHSWGSSIGALFASRYPEYLHAYISTGQSVNPLKNERLSYEFVYDKAVKENRHSVLRQLSKIDTTAATYKLEDALLIRKWVYRFGGVVRKTNQEKTYINYEEIAAILTASEYSILDRLSMLIYPYYSAQKLWSEIKNINLMEQAKEIDVPVYFIVGRYDYIVSHILAEKYFNILDAPRGKELIWFENSAHRPFTEESEKFLEVMNKKILIEVLARSN